MSPKHTYGMIPAGVDLGKLSGTLIVIEGPDSSGRSTQIALLTQSLEEQGHAVAQVGLRRSSLVGPELDKAKRGNILSPRTLGLFYATRGAATAGDGRVSWCSRTGISIR